MPPSSTANPDFDHALDSDTASGPHFTFMEVLIAAGSDNAATKERQRRRTYRVQPEQFRPAPRTWRF